MCQGIMGTPPPQPTKEQPAWTPQILSSIYIPEKFQ